MALTAICGVLCAEGLGAVVTCAAELAVIDVLHGDCVAALLHLEETGLMAICAFVAGFGMHSAVKGNFAAALAV